MAGSPSVLTGFTSSPSFPSLSSSPIKSRYELSSGSLTGRGVSCTTTSLSGSEGVSGTELETVQPLSITAAVVIAIIVLIVFAFIISSFLQVMRLTPFSCRNCPG